MWIRQLEVWHFAGIRHASLTFGPGLNVLHGPNELGKSSLVRAIRAALLLPDSSSARKSFVDWHADQAPQVTLVFETEPGRIWKVRKSFGTGSEGWSYLEFSKDGVTFGQEAKGREVDGRLRELLRWGIAGPGGRTRSRGLPDSFLATALLADQKDVEAVLHRRLDEDSDDSGAQRLTEALQALAEDPVFRRVVEATQERVDEAFTATGRRRSGLGSPWVALRDQRKQVTARRSEVRSQVEESLGAQRRATELREQIDATLERLEAARAARKATEAAWKQQEARREVEARVERARLERDRIANLQALVGRTGAELKQRQGELVAAEQARQAAEVRSAEAAQALKQARERSRELESGGAVQERRLREEQIGKVLVELDAREKEARARQEQAARAGLLEQKTRAAREETQRRFEAVAAAEGHLAELQRQVEQRVGELAALREQQRVLRLLAARRALASAQDKARAVEEQRATVEQSLARARKIRAEVAAAALPGESEMKTLEALERELDVAEAALAVGLSVTVRPVGKLEVAIEVDEVREAQERELSPGGAISVDAQRRMNLRIKDVADVEIVGGSAALRAAAKERREQWERATREAFARAGVASLEQLEERVRACAARADEAAALEAGAREAQARAEGAGDVQAALRAAQNEATLAEARVTAELGEGVRLESVVQRWRKAEGADLHELGSRSRRLEQALEESERRAAELRQETVSEQAVMASKTLDLEALDREATGAAAALGEGWKDVQRAAAREVNIVARSRGEGQAELDRLSGEGAAERDLAREAVEAGEAALARANGELEAARQAEKQARSQVDELQGVHRVQGAHADREDLPAAEADLKQWTVQLEALPPATSPLTEDDLAAAETTLQKLTADHQHLQSEYQLAEGALRTVGGQYVQERYQQVEESLHALEEREHETELDYGAWRLLLETVKDCEREDAVHLGKTLVDPVARRMSELTRGRYESLGLGPKLETRNVEVAGVPRDLSALSVGTREQLATVLRLTIAETLKSVLVLDDQLVQSDSRRMEWLASFMAECAKEFQILVFTCRPEEYRTDVKGEVEHRELELTGLVERSARE